MKQFCKITALRFVLVIALLFSLSSVTALAASPTLVGHHKDWQDGEQGICLQVKDVALTESQVRTGIKNNTLQETVMQAANPQLQYLSRTNAESTQDFALHLNAAAQTSAELKFNYIDLSAVKAIADRDVGYTGYRITFYMDRTDLTSRWIEATLYVTPSPDPVITGIEIQTAPTKTSYIEGENFNAAGMVIMARDSENMLIDVTDQCSFEPQRALLPADTSITVLYEGFTTRQDIIVTANPASSSESSSDSNSQSELTLERIAITTAPNKTSYVPGDKFDPSGMVVTGYYSNGSEGQITDYGILVDDPIKTTTGCATIYVGSCETRQYFYVVSQPNPTPTPNPPSTPSSSSSKPALSSSSQRPSSSSSSKPVSSSSSSVSMSESVSSESEIDSSLSESVSSMESSSTSEIIIEMPVASELPVESSSSSSEAPVVPAQTQEEPKTSLGMPVYGVMTLMSIAAAICFAFSLIPDFQVLSWYKKKKQEALNRMSDNTEG